MEVWVVPAAVSNLVLNFGCRIYKYKKHYESVAAYFFNKADRRFSQGSLGLHVFWTMEEAEEGGGDRFHW